MQRNGLRENQSALFSFLSERHVNVKCVSHLHATMEIVLVTEGILHMTISKTEYDIPAGYGVLVAPFEVHSFHSASPNHCHVLAFSKEMVRHFFEFVKGNVPTSHLFAVSKAAMRLSEELLPQSSNTADYMRAEAVLAPLCYDAWRGCCFEERETPFDDTVARSLEYVNGHFYEDTSLESVARAVGVHPVTLSKIFSRHTGVGFQRYLQYRRCEHAARLIKTTDASFSQIAYESGFGSIRSFNRAFQAVYGQTPTEYKDAMNIV